MRKGEFLKQEADIFKVLRDIVWIFGGLFSLVWFFSAGARVFEVQKIFLFRSVVIIALAFHLLFLLFLKKKNIYKDSKIFNIIFFILVVWCFASIFSVLFSYSPFISFWGEYYRKGGALTTFTLWAYFFLGIEVFKENKVLNKTFLIYGFWAVFFIANAYGIFQKLGLDPFPWVDNGFDGRVFSAFGQPNFFGDFLAMTLSIFLILFFERKDLDEKILLFFAFFLGFVNLVFTLSRSAWIGFFISSFFSLTIYFWQKKIKIALFSTFGILILSLFSLFILIKSSEIKGDGEVSKILNRTQNLFQTKAGSGGIRVANWKKIWEVSKERPIFGWGKDTMITTSRFNFSKESLNFTTDIEYPDRAHNIFLDEFYTEGLLGFLPFISIIIFAVFFSLKKFLQTKNIDYIILFSVFVAYIFRGLFSFDIQITGVIFWGSLAILVANEFDGNFVQKTQKINFSKNIIFAFGIFVLSILSIFAFSVLPVLADLNYRNSFKKIGTERVKMISESEKIDPLEPRYKFFLAQEIFNTRNIENFLIAEKKVLEFNSKYNKNYDGYKLLGDIYYIFYKSTEVEDFKISAKRAYKVARKSAIGNETQAIEYRLAEIEK